MQDGGGGVPNQRWKRTRLKIPSRAVTAQTRKETGERCETWELGVAVREREEPRRLSRNWVAG